MGYDLKPRNKNLDRFHMGAFSWSWMLDSGVGLVIGAGSTMRPSMYCYAPDKKGRNPYSNSGFHVTAEQARMMARAAFGLVTVRRFVNKEWDELPLDERTRMEEFNERTNTYKKPVREDFIEKAERFAKWAMKSQGFWIF